jgi:copper chaperone CopZ
MENQKFAFSLILILLLAGSIACRSSENKSVAPMNQEPVVIEASIGGMFCTDCEQTIQNKVGELPGIKSVKASHTAGNAIIEYYPDKVDSVKIKEAIAGTGYKFNKFIIH